MEETTMQAYQQATRVYRPRGFAAMSSEKQKAIASKGGKTAHSKGTAHQFTSEEARRAGKIGGLKISADRQHMARIGRKGGQNSSLSVFAFQAVEQLDLPIPPPFEISLITETTN